MWISLIIVIILLGFASALLYKQNSHEPELGIKEGMLKPMPDAPNAISSQTDDKSKKVSPLPFKENLSDTMEAIVHAVNTQQGAQITTQDEHYLYVVFTSKLFRFKDDVEFYLDQETRLVHFRSASRAGKSDLGVNRKRYEQLRLSYEQR